MSFTLEDSAKNGVSVLVGHREPTEEDKKYLKELERAYIKDMIWQATPFFWIQCKIRKRHEKDFFDMCKDKD